MAVDAFGVAWRSHLSIRRHPILCLRKARYGKSTFATEPLSDSTNYNDRSENDDLRARKRNEPEWEKLSSKELGIKMTSISKSTRVVLSALRKNGHEVYLVGGCVRDLILKRTPKDFDIITSAELKEVRNSFGCCEIVGKRFPICHVRVNDTTVEVSSFSTFAKNSGDKFDEAERPPGCDRHDYIRWRNCLSRDFTINGLMFDPYAKIVYDYTGGLQDIRKSKIRTVIPAKISFVEDCARILRAVRIAARLGFRFTKDTALSLRELSCSVRRLDKGRILLEMNYMMAFGSSEASLRLLWRFGLLETLLPIQASYLASQGFRRRDERSNMLLCLFLNLDKFLAPDRPCHTSLWVAILAFHKALVDQPRDPLVVSALCLAISGGGSLSAAANMAAKVSEPHDTKFDEIVEPERALSKTALVNEIFDLTESAKFALHMMTDPNYVSRAMARFPRAPRSNLVYISVALSVKVCKIFDLISRRQVGDCNPKIGERVNYDSLALGTLAELQNVFATVVLNTIYPSKFKN